MSVSVRIKGPDCNPIGARRIGDRNHLLVATAPAVDRVFLQKPILRTTDGEKSLNVNGLPPQGGSNTIVWNGTGVTDTGGDWTHSELGSESAAAANSGTNGLDTGLMPKNGKVRFTNGSEIAVASFTSLSFWIQPKAIPPGGKLTVQWFRPQGGTFTATSTKLDVEAYATLTIDSWSRVVIPMGDFNITADSSRLQFVAEVQKDQHYWIDDIELVDAAGGSGPFIYRVESLIDKFFIDDIQLLIVDAEIGWALADFAASADGGLENGLLIRHWNQRTGEVFSHINILDNSDLFGRMRVFDDVSFIDTSTLLSMGIDTSHAPPEVFGDKVIDIVVRDDLSAITRVQAFVTGGTDRA